LGVYTKLNISIFALVASGDCYTQWIITSLFTMFDTASISGWHSFWRRWDAIELSVAIYFLFLAMCWLVRYLVGMLSITKIVYSLVIDCL